MDLRTAWADAPEGTRERMLHDMLRLRGVDFVCRSLFIERAILDAWVRDGVPYGQHQAVRDAHRCSEAARERSGISKIDVDRALAMKAAGEKQSVIAATFGVTPQAVSKRIKAAQKKAQPREKSDAA